MKWYWYVLIGVAVLVAGYFGYKMMRKDNGKTTTASNDTPAGASGGATGGIKPTEGMTVVTDEETDGGNGSASAGGTVGTVKTA